MADPYGTPPLTPAGMINDRYQPRSHTPGGGGFSAAFQDAGQEESGARAGISASVFGIPPEQMTEPVRKALSLLLDELTRLRQGAERLIGHEDYLDRLSHQCDLTEVANRRGLAREINRATTRMAQGGMGGTIVLLRLHGLEAFRDAEGYAAAVAAQRHAAAALAARLRQSDTVANLGGGDFAVFLGLSWDEEAETKAGELATAINAPPLPWNGRGVVFTVAWGKAALTSHSDLDSLLAEADAARRPLG